MSLGTTTKNEIIKQPMIADQLTRTDQGEAAIFLGWVEGNRPYITLRWGESPAPANGKILRESELNLDIWHNGPSPYRAQVLAEAIIQLLDERHIPEQYDSRQIYRFHNARSIYVPEPDQSVAHWNITFTVRWVRAAFIDTLLEREVSA